MLSPSADLLKRVSRPPADRGVGPHATGRRAADRATVRPRPDAGGRIAPVRIAPALSSARLRRHGLVGLTAAAALYFPLAALLPHAAARDALAALPFALSLFAVGMPHGALDGAVFRGLSRDRPRGWVLTAAGLYLAVDLVFLAGLWAAPAALLVVFLAVTVVHFGHADGAAHPARPAFRGYARAALVVLLPFVFQPDETLRVFTGLTRLAGGTTAFPTAVAPAAAAVCLAAGVVLAAAALRSLRDGGVRVAGGEVLWVALVGTTAALLPPLYGVGLWFIAWHALPELHRVATTWLPGDPALPWVRTGHAASAALLVPTLLLALPLAANSWKRSDVAGSASGAIVTLAGITLLAYAVLTPAHELLQRYAAKRATRETL